MMFTFRCSLLLACALLAALAGPSDGRGWRGVGRTLWLPVRVPQKVDTIVPDCIWTCAMFGMVAIEVPWPPNLLKPLSREFLCAWIMGGRVFPGRKRVGEGWAPWVVHLGQLHAPASIQRPARL